VTTRTFTSANEALIESLREINTQGNLAYARNIETKEILNFSFKLSNPRNRMITIRERRWSKSMAVGELSWHLSASNDVERISYYSRVWSTLSKNGKTIDGSCYGKHIFSKQPNFGMSQWENVISLLKADKNSRRAVLAMPMGILNHSSVEDFPCITTIQFLVRNNRLDCITTMRSNDVIWGLCYDIFFVTMLQEILSVELEVDLGHYYHNATSMHLYKRFYKLSDEILSSPPPAFQAAMNPIDDIGQIDSFLEVEELLRKGDKSGLTKYENLNDYWKDLAEPLLIKSKKKHNF
jgi:thymidylate synthase